MTVDIGRFAVRWRLPDDSARQVAAASLDRLLDGPLEAALGGLAGPDELVAVASVAVGPVLLRGAEDVDGWAAMVAAAVADRLAAGGPDVVRYRNARAARVDVVTRAALGDPRREWAWRRFGLWPERPAADAVAEILAADPEGIAPVLSAVARASVLPAAIRLFGPARLLELARAAWVALGGVLPSTVDLPLARGSSEVRSPIVSAARGTASVAADDPVSTLAPGAVGRSVAPGWAADPGRVPGGEPEGTPVALRFALAALAVADAEPDAVAAGVGPSRLAAVLTGDAIAAEGAERLSSIHSRFRGSGEEASRVALAAPGATDAPLAGDDVVPPSSGGLAAGRPVRPAAQGGATRWAGLLFCLHPLRPLLVPRHPGHPGPAVVRPPDPARLAELRLRAVMHSLGGALAAAAAGPTGRPPRPDDPALLAFCGLPPDAEPPHPVADDTLIGGLVADTVDALRRRLAGRPPAAGVDLAAGVDPDSGAYRQPAATALLAAVAYRRADIIADPGRLDVHLDPDEVSVDLRAAGLDLDPGWLPGLGCVVRFHYD